LTGLQYQDSVLSDAVKKTSDLLGLRLRYKRLDEETSSLTGSVVINGPLRPTANTGRSCREDIMRIYYFTGTGNSLAVARMVAAKLGTEDAPELVPIASVTEEQEIPSEPMGLIFPIYMHRPPHIVMRFIERITTSPYVFMVAVNGGDVGRAFSTVSRLLRKRGVTLSAGFSVTMPSNYLPFGEAAPEEERKEVYRNASEKADEIVSVVSSRGSHFDKQANIFAALIHPGLMYAMGYNFINTLDRSFTADEDCNGCGICVRVCPVGNVRLEDGTPVWSGNCEQCFACIQFCPQTAIQYGDKTKGLRRYHHPDVTVADIAGQSPKQDTAEG